MHALEEELEELIKQRGARALLTPLPRVEAEQRRKEIKTLVQTIQEIKKLREEISVLEEQRNRAIHEKEDIHHDMHREREYRKKEEAKRCKLLKELDEKEKANENLIKALEDICKHMRTVAPNCSLSTVVVIATKALELAKDRH